MATGGGFSKARLERVRRVLGGRVEQGEVAGLVTLISRRGETHVETIGLQSTERRDGSGSKIEAV